jgi:hypothetical protein
MDEGVDARVCMRSVEIDENRFGLERTGTRRAGGDDGCGRSDAKGGGSSGSALQPGLCNIGTGLERACKRYKMARLVGIGWQSVGWLNSGFGVVCSAAVMLHQCIQHSACRLRGSSRGPGTHSRIH